MSQDQKSLGQLFSDLTTEISSLVRNEVRLAKAELSQKASLMGRSIALLVVAGLLGFLGLQALTAAAILGLATSLPAWAAALIVGAVLALLAGALAMKGASDLKAEKLTPRETIESLQEDAQWAKQNIP